MLNLKKMNDEQLDKLIGSLENVLNHLDNDYAHADVQLSLPLESSDRVVAADERPAVEEVPGLSVDRETRDRIAAKFRAAYGPGALATQELNDGLLDSVIQYADQHTQVQALADSIETEGKKLLSQYMGIPYVGK